ncbi:J domain-containing protein [Anopheles bellator]|uniref:J domain-containing protein n=1 Tax=Anopheles bellator TaxID=139047 RepID=UPI0026470A44|nr:J domain-containing protein [Anopheles bellator]XP_058064230.1 J domain-containing protein [Anopheles bellator]
MSSGVEEILSYKRDSKEDLYALLNCNETSTVDQIQAEFKILALQYHPDKNAGDKESEAKFQQLKEAKETLCDPEKRASYDKWRNSGIQISYKNWLGMKEHVQQSMHWAIPKTKDRMLPDGAGASGPGAAGSGSGLSAAQPNPAHRRASEGGAALYYGSRKGEWGTENSSEVVNKFRNYEI